MTETVKVAIATASEMSGEQHSVGLHIKVFNLKGLCILYEII